MRLAVVDLHRPGGHHHAYLRALAKEAVRRGWRVRVVRTKEASEHESGQSLQRLGPLVEVVSSDSASELAAPSRNLAAAQLRAWQVHNRVYRDLVEPYAPDVVHLLDVDPIGMAVSVMGSPFGEAPWSTLWLRPRFHHPAMGVETPVSFLHRIGGPLALGRLLSIPSLVALLAVDETLPEWLRMKKFRGRAKVQYIPDLGSVGNLVDQREARFRLHLDTTRFWLLCYGALSSRKGIRQLLEALDDPATADVGVLAAGAGDAAASAILSSDRAKALIDGGRLITLRGHVNDTLEGLIFSAVDAVWLGYRQHYTSSGVYFQALSAGRRVIACREGLIGYWTRLHKTGVVVNPDNTAEVIAAIQTLKSNSGPDPANESARQVIARSHTESAFGYAVCSAIESRTAAKDKVSPPPTVKNGQRLSTMSS